MAKYIEYTADDEDPNCMLCDHVNDSYEFCEENCGAEHGWCGYRRYEKMEENDIRIICIKRKE